MQYTESHVSTNLKQHHRRSPVTTGFRLAALPLALAAATGPALAQDNGGGRAATTLEEIVVTARRRSETLQEVPIMVNAVGSETLDNLNMRSLEDVESMVAGLTLEPDTIGSNASLRGVRLETFASGNNPTVQFYLNDAPTQTNIAMQALFDIEQIEVLRGPQGTLRGRAAPSGAITIATKKAELNNFGGYLDTTVTDEGGQNVRAAVNVPLVDDMLAFRAAGVFEENEGTQIESINNDASTENETTGYRASLRFVPFDSLSIDAMHQRLEPERTQNLQVESANLENPDLPAPAQGHISDDDRLGVTDIPESSEQVLERTSVQVDWETKSFQVQYVGALTDTLLDRKIPGDAGDIFGPGSAPELQNFGQEIRGNTAEAQSHELRLSSSVGAFDYALGGLYYKHESDNDLISPTPIFLPPAFGGSFLTVAETPIITDSEDVEKSVYGNLTWHLTNATELSAGLRFLDVERSTTVTAGSSVISDIADDWTDEIYSLSLKHRFSEQLMAYASVGSSWRPGVNAIGNFSTQQTQRERNFQSLEPETSDSFEIGFKADLLDRRLRLNGAVFYQQFDNYVYRASGSGVPYVSTDARTGTESVERFNFVAGVPVDVFGAELEAIYKPTDQLTVSGIYSWSQGLIDDGTIPCNDYLPADGKPDASGAEPTVEQIRAATDGDNVAACQADFRANFAPLWTASLSSQYTFPVMGQDGFVRGLLTVYGDSKNDPTNEVDDVESYAMLDVFAGIRSSDGQWEITLFGKNLTGTERVLNRNANPASLSVQRLDPVSQTTSSDRITSDYREISVTKPREFGINLRYNF